MELNELLSFMAKKEASDLHLKPMRPPLLRIKGQLVPINTPPLKPEQLQEMLLNILTPVQMAKLDQYQSVDLSHGVPGVARFRGNIYYQRSTMAAVFRRVPFEIATIESLHLPDVISTFSQYGAGLVLITGPTGSGKSTTLAAIVDQVGKTRNCHIVTIEDPIEFLFRDNKAAISQREVGTDTPGFKQALRNAMRQDPDVIMVGEMRDVETIETVITAAETGHLVFSTLHTNSAAQTIDRIIDSFSSEHQQQIRGQLSLVLKAVVSMKLVPKGDNTGMLPACEVLLNSPKIAKHIELGEIREIHEEMEGSVSYYKMQSMNQSLIALLAHGEIDYDTAVEASPNADDLSLKLRKMLPQLDERANKGGSMAPSASDFSQIHELLEVKRLYEETEDRHAHNISEKELQIAELQDQLNAMRTALASGNADEAEREVERMRSENERLKAEATKKINQLNDRIRELNQRLAGGDAGGTPPKDGGSGFFRR